MRCAAGIEMSAVHKSAEKLLELSGGVCAAIRSPSGALAVSKKGLKAMEGRLRIASFKIQSAVVRGHVFVAGFFYQYHKSEPLSEYLKAGHTAAASRLLDSTTSGGFKRLASCLELIEKFGQRDADHSTMNHHEAA
jgi:fructose-1-phosphate kinase PfkB-like protein